MKRSLKNKILIGVPVIFIAVMIIIAVVMSAILSKQNSKTANTLLQNTFNIVRYTISEKQEELLFDSHQMVSIDNMGRKIKYITENGPYFKYNTLRPTYMKIAGVIFGTSTAANIWKANIYNLDGDLMAFSVIEEDRSILGCVYNRETIEVASLRPGEELVRESWTRWDSLPSGTGYSFDKAIPDEEEIHFEIIQNSLCLVAYIPVVGKEYNTASEKIETKQVGMVMTVQRIGNNFVGKILELSNTDIGIFNSGIMTCWGGNCNVHADYKTFNLDKFPQVEKGWSLTDQPVIFSDVDIAGSSYFQGVLPIYSGSKCVAAIVSLYSKEMARAGTVQIIKLLSLVYLVGIILIMPITILTVVRGIINPIERIASMMREIAHRKDFTKMLHIESQDEIGELASSFNEMNENLRQSTTSIDNLNREITERKKAEEALQESSARLKAIFDTVQAGIFLIDAESHIIVDVNQSAAAMIGLPKEQIIGKECHKYVCPAEQGKCPISDLGQTVDNSEKILLTADGKGIPILKTVTPVVLIGKSYLLESFVNLTERKKAEEELLKTEERYRVQFEGALDAIFIADAETGILIDCNPAGTKLVGREKSELVGKSHRILHPPMESEEKFHGTFKEHLEDKCDQTLETQIITKTGEIRDVAVKANLLEIGGKKVLQGIFRDVTEHRKSEEALQRLNIELEATVEKLRITNRELADYAHVTAHDLKAPLRGIGSLAGMILMDYGDNLDENGREMLNVLVGRTKRMTNQINSILQYSEIGRTEEIKGRIDLNYIVGEVISNIGVPENIEVIIENELPVVVCDATRISQVFQNLLDNAIRHMNKPEGRIKIGCVEEDRWFKFSISDNGPGIEERYFKKIFKIFQSLDRRDDKEATGIGLSLVKKIIKVYGGEVWLESKIGQGSTFFFTLPK